jgi:hypothetical protein
VTSDELLGNIRQVITDDLRLRTDCQDIVSNSLDQCRLPAGRNRAEGVPCMAGDQT